MNPINKALAVVLALAILSNGGLAVYLSHVSVTVTYTLGTPPDAAQATIDASQLLINEPAVIPAPKQQRKPSHVR